MKFEVLEMVNENNKKALREKEAKKLKNRIKKLFKKWGDELYEIFKKILGKNKTKNIFRFIGLEHDCFDIGNYKIIA